MICAVIMSLGFVAISIVSGMPNLVQHNNCILGVTNSSQFSVVDNVAIKCRFVFCDESPLDIIVKQLAIADVFLQNCELSCGTLQAANFNSFSICISHFERFRLTLYPHLKAKNYLIDDGIFDSGSRAIRLLSEQLYISSDINVGYFGQKVLSLHIFIHIENWNKVIESLDDLFNLVRQDYLNYLRVTRIHLVLLSLIDSTFDICDKILSPDLLNYVNHCEIRVDLKAASYFDSALAAMKELNGQSNIWQRKSTNYFILLSQHVKKLAVGWVTDSIAQIQQSKVPGFGLVLVTQEEESSSIITPVISGDVIRALNGFVPNYYPMFANVDGLPHLSHRLALCEVIDILTPFEAVSYVNHNIPFGHNRQELHNATTSLLCNSNLTKGEQAALALYKLRVTQYRRHVALWMSRERFPANPLAPPLALPLSYNRPDDIFTPTTGDLFMAHGVTEDERIAEREAQAKLAESPVEVQTVQGDEEVEDEEVCEQRHLHDCVGVSVRTRLQMLQSSSQRHEAAALRSLGMTEAETARRRMMSATSSPAAVVFITAIFGGIEQSCKKFARQSISADFVCFTDDPLIRANGWQVDHTPYHHLSFSLLTRACRENHEDDQCLHGAHATNSLINNDHPFNIAKFYKLNFQAIARLAQYDVVVWLDGSVQVHNDRTAELLLARVMLGQNFIMFESSKEHRFGRLSEEVQASVGYDKYYSPVWRGHKQPVQDVQRQYEHYLAQGFNDSGYWASVAPMRPHYGLWNTCFMAFDVRPPSRAVTHKALHMWHDELIRHTTQDQVSLPYVAQMLHIMPHSLPDLPDDPLSNLTDMVSSGLHVYGNFDYNNLFVKLAHGN